MKVENALSIFDSWLGKIDPTVATQRGSLSFNIRVGCIKSAAPRDEKFSFLLEMGAIDINKVFNNNSFNKDELTFVFPERHMSVQEQHSFISILNKHQDIKNGLIKNVDILTSSPLIIGNFHRESILILQWSDDYKYSGLMQN